jgi:hypothetical protein
MHNQLRDNGFENWAYCSAADSAAERREHIQDFVECEAHYRPHEPVTVDTLLPVGYTSVSCSQEEAYEE